MLFLDLWNIVEPWKNNMIMNNCFHADYSQAEAAAPWKRDWETLKGADKSVSESQATCLAGEILWSRRGLRRFLVKVPLLKFVPYPRPSPPPPPLFLRLFLGKLWKRSEQKRPQRERSFLCSALGPALTHWLFYLMWNSTRSAEPRQLLPQQNNNTPTPLVSVSQSLFRRKQPELHQFLCLFFFCSTESLDEVVRAD